MPTPHALGARLGRYLSHRHDHGRSDPWRATTDLSLIVLLAAAAGALIAAGLLWYFDGSVAERMVAGDGPVALVFALVVVTGLLALLLVVRGRDAARTAHADRGDLRAAGETLRAVLGATSQGVILADPDLRVRLLNPAAEMLFGRLSDEAASLPVQVLIPSFAMTAETEATDGEDAAGPRLRHCTGLRRGGEAFPLRVLLRNLTLEGESWLLILAEDLAESERAEAQIDYLENHDALTGLNNRRTLERLIGAAVADPDRAAQPHALCLIDLDHFKLINGTCGHAAGDKLLKQLGQIISTKLGAAAVLARLGGDEFAALFVGEAVASAECVCADLVRTVRSFPFTWRERTFDVSVSIGLVNFAPVEGALSALGRADIACQVAKTRGGDRLHLFSPEDVNAIRRLGDVALISTIGRALDENRFRVMAQPIKPLQVAGAAMHYEILVRMQDDQGRSVAPNQFIPAAERYVLMPAVDRWILAHVLGRQAEQLRAWHEQHPGQFMLAVNLSATTLVDEGFLPYLKRQFSDYRVPYQAICFEVTETNAVSDLGRARTFMQSLCDLGSSFAVDDFGTGFASYTYVKSLPVRYIKIDGSFVRNLANDPVDRAVVESINHVAHVLQLQTIAEWAETPAAVEILRDLGVDFAQGYGVGPAVTLDDLRLHRSLGTAG